MIKVFGYLKRKSSLSAREFADYYERNHVPLVLSKAFMPIVYKRNYIQRGDVFNIEGEDLPIGTRVSQPGLLHSIRPSPRSTSPPKMTSPQSHSYNVVGCFPPVNFFTILFSFHFFLFFMHCALPR